MKIFYKSLLLAAIGILIQIGSIGHASDKLDLVVFTAKKVGSGYIGTATTKL